MRLFIFAFVATSFAAGIDATDTPSFLGTYLLSDSTLFDEYMEALGVGFFIRQLASAAAPTTIISRNGDDWSISTDWTFKNTEMNFKLEQEFDELTWDDRSCKSTITQDGENTLVHIQRCDNGLEMRIIRTFDGNVMTETLLFPFGDSRICTRIYDKI